MRKGFTLIELLIYVGLMSIFIFVLTEIFLSVLDTQRESEASSSALQDGTFILSRLIYDVNRADAIVIPANLGDQTSSLQLTIDGVNYTYRLNGYNLEFTNNQLNSFGSRVTNFSVRRIGNPNGKNSVKVAFTIESTIQQSGGFLEIRNFDTTVGLR
ncbi:prepilin-type N-terminal cleavage/methylation domain-containing protein [Candidatus Woesebacteria bacterium]|nr:prepilin-type N-terminal cleavage/methylation domain-containing protein [Candidatus Woesebacteria bacterium]